MSTMKSKALSAVLTATTTIWLSGAVMLVPVAHGQTTADLQSQIASLLAQIAALQAQLGGGSGSAAAAALCNFTRSLTVGSTGNDVKCLQQYLNSTGNKVADSGAGSPGNESTYFGPKTKTAVAKWQAANGVSPAAGFFGSISQAKYKAVAGTGPGTTPMPGVTPIPGTNLSIMAASDNPAGAIVPKGASAVPVLKFVVSGNGTLNGLTFKRNGVGSTADFASAGLYLYEGNNRVTSGRSLNTTSNEVSFVNLALAVSGTRTFWLGADIATGATAGNSNYFTLSSADGTPSVSGTAMGNNFQIGGASAGVATTTKVGSLSSTTVGATNVQIGEFRLDVSSAEDVNVTSVAMTQGGSISNGNLSNFVLKQNDVTVATAASIGVKDLVTLVFNSPFKVEKGQQKTFKLFADISGSAKSGDQIKMYFDSASDVKAKGLTFGFNVVVDISGMDSASEAHTVELKGGDVTITFNGPITKDVAVRGQDVEVYNFTIATKNTIEVRNLRFGASTTAMTGGKAFNDFKVWDTSNNTVITSAVDITSGTDTNITLNDVFTVAAGASKTFKVTVDIDPDNVNNDTLKVSLQAFTASDIKNLDNNQFVSTGSIVPNSLISGNTMTVKAPSLDVQLSSDPSSQTLVQGAAGKKLVAFGFKATADTIKVSTIKITASFSSGTLTSGEVTSLALYDGDTRVSDIQSLNSSDLTATFNNLNVQVADGTTKTLVVKGNISTDASNGDVWHIKINSTSSDVTATDSNGNNATITGVAANSAGTVAVTIANVGTVNIVKNGDDSESEAGIMLAGGERVLGKFRFTASNEDLTVNKLHILIASSSVSVANSDGGSVVDDVPTIKLYDGSTQIGASSGYNVNSSGASTSIAEVSNLGWVIPKDGGSKVLTVKGVVPSIGQNGSGADFGSSIWTSIMASGFEAQGSTQKITSVSAVKGNEKLIYKTAPNFTSVTAGTAKLTAGTIPVLKFKIKADGPEQIAWKQIQFRVTVTQASMAAVESAPGTSVGNVGLRDVTNGGSTQLNIASAFSSASTSTGEQVALGSASGQTGYVSLLLNAEQTVAAGTEKEYELSLNFSGLSSTVGASTFVVRIHQTETAKSTGTVTGVRASITTTTDAAPSFVWSDYSVSGHTDTEGPTATSSADWANSYLLKGMPSNTVTLSN